MIDFVKRFISSLSDAEMAFLKNELHNQEYERIQTCLKDGNYPALNAQEIQCIGSGQKIQAIRHYRDRTEYGLLLCKAVVDKYQFEQEEKKKLTGN